VLKRLNIVTVLLVTNLVLVGVVAWLIHAGRPASAPSLPEADTAAAPRIGGTATRPLKVVKTNLLAAQMFRWSQVESDDYRAYIERLRAIGCPDQTIRDLIIADIDKLFAPRMVEANPAARDLGYWQSDDKEIETTADHLERQRRQREIDFAKRQILQELLGIDVVSERSKTQGAEDRFGRRLSFLPDDKRNTVRMLLEEYNAQEVAVRQKTWEEGEALTAEDRARLKELERQREDAVAKALSPAELERYQMAMSPLAYKLRESLFGMNANEQEYKDLYQLRQGFEQRWPEEQGEPTDPQKRQQWAEAKAELEKSIEEKLGAERYAEYARARDPDYRALAITAARYKLAPAVAQEVYEYRRVFLEQRAFVTGNRSLTAEQQAAALKAMTVETMDVIRSRMGAAAFEQYLRGGHGAWMQP
jgi:hypothetical protein